MRQHGVTLIQMMLALGLVGVLTQLAIPAYVNLSDDLHQASVARELAQALRAARSQAMLHQQEVQVVQLQENWGAGWQVMMAQAVLLERHFERPLRIAANASHIRFSGQGVPRQGNGSFLGATLEVCNRPEGAGPLRVVLAPSGRVSLRTDMAGKPLCAGR